MNENRLNKLKKFLQENCPNIQAFDTRNWVGDEMSTIYDKDGITVDRCYYHDYIEIFGLTDKEFLDLVPEGAGGDLRTFEV